MKTIILFLPIFYVVICWFNSKLFYDKNITPTFISVLMCYCPILHLYTFIVHVIVKRGFQSNEKHENQIKNLGTIYQLTQDN